MAIPSFSEFSPEPIPWQDTLVDDWYNNINWENGKQEFLLSGSVGSAKSCLCAHLVIRHCIENPRARVMIGRKAMPDLKSTFMTELLEHLEGTFTEGVHYTFNRSIGQFDFRNGSQIISRSWSDKNFKKLRSLILSGAVIEEGTENEGDFYQAIKEIRMRVGRRDPERIKQQFLLIPTNPDSPSHPLYKDFMINKNKNRHVYYSVTSDNPFLPPTYIENLKSEMDEREARRMLFGEWLEIVDDMIYYNYDRNLNFINKSYDIKLGFPIHVSFDFNIGEGKPFSVAFIQHIHGVTHIFNEIVLKSSRTMDALDEALHKGLLDHPVMYIINGDAAGKARDTRSVQSDYDIIKKFFSNALTRTGRAIRFRMEVPRSNPPIRTRHNQVRARICDANGNRRLFVYKDAPTADEGLRLTKLKSGGKFVEDDSFHAQHITTSIGYSICTEERKKTQSSIMTL